MRTLFSDHEGKNTSRGVSHTQCSKKAQVLSSNCPRWPLAVIRVLVAFLMFSSISASLTGSANAIILHVAPDGNDAWSGRLMQPDPGNGDGPLASLQGARDRVRALKKLKPLTEPIRIVIAEGTYQLKETVIFTPEDSGTAKFPIIYESSPGAKPVFTGGRQISGFQPNGEGLWVATIPEVRSGTWYFEQLWVNGKRAVRARSPRQSYYYVAQTAETSSGAMVNSNKSAFMAKPEDVAVLGGVVPGELRDVAVVVYHAWETSRHRISEINPATGLVTLTGPAPWPFLEYDISQRYHLENFRGALDEPGEWYLGRNGALYYKPLPGEDMAKAEVVAPVGPKQFIHFAGRPGEPVAHIVMKGLSFRHGQYLLPQKGHGDVQAEISISAAIEAEMANGIILEDCEVAHIGNHAVWFHRGSRECRIINGYIHDLGAGGIRIGDGFDENLSNSAMHTQNILVENTIIHGGGRIHAGGCGIWVGHSGHNQLIHNDISDFFYTGISLGWVWGYQSSLAVENHVEFNHIHHLGQGVLDDLGGVYTLGPSPGTVIRNNVIHDVYAYNYGGWGLYNDEGSSDIILENNLVYNTGNGSYHLHYGRNNLVRNNIFCNGSDGQIQRSRVEMQVSLAFTNNIVCWEQGPLVVAGSIQGQTVIFKNNLYWKAGGVEPEFQGQSLAQRQAVGQDLGSLVADPLFIDPLGGDFRLRQGSPAEKIGFEPFDVTRVGVYGRMATIANKLIFPEVKLKPSFSLNEDFDHSPVGSRPPFAHCFTDNLEWLIAVTDTVGVGGGRSLAVHDMEGLAYPYLPYFYYDPDYREGMTVFSFDMRVEEGVVMYHEWRDDKTPYGVGPSFWIRDGRLEIDGRPVLTLPNGNFVNFRVTAALGSDSTGTWDLDVMLPDQTLRHFKRIRNGSAQWKHLDWLGFSSMAVDKHVFYLDNLHIVNLPSK